MEDETTSVENHEKAKKFRFKRSHRQSSNKVNDAEESPRRQHHSHHKRKRLKLSPASDTTSYPHNGYANIDPDSAFKESLYDAMGDDEGAQYWQNVYGQPIHNYPNSYTNPETGELQTMTDEEYASYVRRKMWEKSWEGIEAAREEMRKQKRKEQEEAAQNSQNQTRGPGSARDKTHYETDHEFERQVEASLRRGARRQERKRRKSLWEAYLSAWENLQSMHAKRKSADIDQQIDLQDHIAWPTETGKRENISTTSVHRFVEEGARSIDSADDFELVRTSLLKSERIKWHPDKIQQRYGFMHIDEQTMQSVTAVFQILDQLWNDTKPRG